MIIDKLENLSRYDYVPNVQKVIDFVTGKNLNEVVNGKYDLGDECYVNVSEYDAKCEPDDCIELEAHVNYLDVQLASSGDELLYFQSIELGESIIDYDKKKDIEFFTAEWYNSVVLSGNIFALIFPNDLHAGGFTAGGNDKIKKFVFKLKI